MNTPANFELHLQFAVPGERVFTALSTANGVKKWWTQFCVVSGVVGGQSSFHFPGDGFFAVMKILQLEYPRLLEWECVDSNHHENKGFTDLHNWVGTRIRFEIKELNDGKSQLDFTHFRLNQLECHDMCSSGWSFFLNESLRGYLEHGKGQPWDKDK
jgi:uncharacterized protein YndB with AHSA1/START domain